MKRPQKTSVVPNEAKLGLVLGVALVITVAIVYFRQDIMVANAPVEAIAPQSNPNALPVASATTHHRYIKPQPVPISDDTPSVESEMHEHKVAEGDTLFTLAEKYFGDGDRFADLYRCNRHVLRNPDSLQPGMVLRIPVGERKISAPRREE